MYILNNVYLYVDMFEEVEENGQQLFVQMPCNTKPTLSGGSSRLKINNRKYF